MAILFFSLFFKNTHTCGWQSAFLVNFFFNLLQPKVKYLLLFFFGPWHFKYKSVGNKENGNLKHHSLLFLQYDSTCFTSHYKKSCRSAFSMLFLKSLVQAWIWMAGRFVCVYAHLQSQTPMWLLLIIAAILKQLLMEPTDEWCRPWHLVIVLRA